MWSIIEESDEFAMAVYDMRRQRKPPFTSRDGERDEFNLDDISLTIERMNFDDISKAIERMKNYWKQYCDEMMHKYGDDANELIAKEEKRYADLILELERKKLCENPNSDCGVDEGAEHPFDYSFDYRTQEIPMTPELAKTLSLQLDRLDEKIVSAISVAANNANEIIERHKFTGAEANTLSNRVGHFVNCLRREMTPFNAELRKLSNDFDWRRVCDFLTNFNDTRFWMDIATPTPNYGWAFSTTLAGKTWGMSFDRIQELTMQIKSAYIDPVLATTDKVKDGLADLEKGMIRMFETINQAKRINTEADKVVSSLSELVETLPKE
jgi:hypothetical protein